MSGEMVRATLRDMNPKTQTRRIVKLPLRDKNSTGCEIAGCEINSMLSQGRWDLCPYGQPGTKLWVRETWTTYGCEAWPEQDRPIFYRADDDTKEGWATPDDIIWKPSIHMPRWASRITLEITNIRVERLQDISGEDAIAEGIERHHSVEYPDRVWWKLYNNDIAHVDPRESYRTLWESINGPESWKANPWVWVVTFKQTNQQEQEK